MKSWIWALNNEYVGGGEVLDYMGKKDGEKYIAMDNELIKQFDTLLFLKIGIVVAILIISILLIFKIFELKTPFKGRAIASELGHIAKVRKRDAEIIRANKLIGRLVNIVESSPFRLGTYKKEYLEYNLERANIRIPGGMRIMEPVEYNAIQTSIIAVVLVFSIIIGILFNIAVGMLLVILTLTTGTTLPLMFMRATVKVKDNEVIENFADMYLMIHYTLLASAGTPLSQILKSFDKTTTSEEMHRFVDCCVHYFDTFGEYDGTSYITKQYREIPQVGKLMRLIRQSNDGGDVRAELMSFRNELLSAKKYEIRKRMDAIIAKARASFNILMIILVQAILSAMAIYFKDLNIAGSFMK